MLTNTPTLQVYQKYNLFGICATVCAFLNTQGGQLLCYNNGKYFERYQDAEGLLRDIEGILRQYISNYPENKIQYNVSGVDYHFLVELVIKEDKDVHYLIEGPKKGTAYIRKNVGNAQYDLGQEYGIMPHKATDSKGLFKIGNYPTGSKYFKYMSLENALQCLRNNNLWFVEPSKWQDKYERYFYNAEINGESCSEKNPVVYSTCVTNKKDSESTWKIYAYNTQGLASRCVQFRLNRKKLREALINAKYRADSKEAYSQQPLKTNYDIYEGVVTYKDEQIVKNLPKPTISKDGEELDNLWHHAYFDDFSFNKYLNLLLLKRNAFEHEQETRFFIVKKEFDSSMAKGRGTKESEAKHLDIQIEWKDIIEGVCYDAKCSDYEKTLLEEELKQVLYGDKDASFNNFIFEPYDVYAAPNPPIIPSVTIK
jgi:hypothetical protein